MTKGFSFEIKYIPLVLKAAHNNIEWRIFKRNFIHKNNLYI